MPNHIHLLTEMLDDPISRVMHGLLTGYSQYHNRKYKKIGHLFQGRYKAILCQTDRYLGELVRYIHLNPVRAKIVVRPVDFEYSGHRAYLGLDRSRLVDAEPVLRHFGANKKRAIEDKKYEFQNFKPDTSWPTPCAQTVSEPYGVRQNRH